MIDKITDLSKIEENFVYIHVHNYTYVNTYTQVNISKYVFSTYLRLKKNGGTEPLLSIGFLLLDNFQ